MVRKRSAEMDGATGWRAFRHVTWPLLRPVVGVVLVLGVVYTIEARTLEMTANVEEIVRRKERVQVIERKLKIDRLALADRLT